MFLFLFSKARGSGNWSNATEENDGWGTTEKKSLNIHQVRTFPEEDLHRANIESHFKFWLDQSWKVWKNIITTFAHLWKNIFTTLAHWQETVDTIVYSIQVKLQEHYELFTCTDCINPRISFTGCACTTPNASVLRNIHRHAGPQISLSACAAKKHSNLFDVLYSRLRAMISYCQGLYQQWLIWKRSRLFAPCFLSPVHRTFQVHHPISHPKLHCQSRQAI